MSETVAAPRVLIMGVGNILLRDEGFGVAAVNHLEKNYDWPENVRLQEGATQGLLLMSELEACDLLVVPTTWNLGPRDAKHVLSAAEQALVGTPVADPKRPVEILRTIHSFDPCIACAVHVIDGETNQVHEFKVL